MSTLGRTERRFVGLLDWIDRVILRRTPPAAQGIVTNCGKATPLGPCRRPVTRAGADCGVAHTNRSSTIPPAARAATPNGPPAVAAAPRAVSPTPEPQPGCDAVMPPVLYHGTFRDAADDIRANGFQLPANPTGRGADYGPAVYITSHVDVARGYSRGKTLPVVVDPNARIMDLGAAWEKGMFDRDPSGMLGEKVRDVAVAAGYHGVTDNDQIVAIYDPSVLSIRKKPAPASVVAIRQRHAHIDNWVSETDDWVCVDKVVVPSSMRNSGHGTAFMRDICDYADSVNKRVELTPSKDFGGSKERLVEIYKRFGFVENKGRNKDFATRETMYRDAQRSS